MSQQTFGEPIDAAIAEYLATFESYWKPKTNAKYRAELRDLCAWLAAEGRPLTTASLDYTTLLAHVGHLKQKPVARGAFRGARVTSGSRSGDVRLCHASGVTDTVLDEISRTGHLAPGQTQELASWSSTRAAPTQKESSIMDDVQVLDQALAFHGHKCWASTAGVRLGLAAMDALGASRSGAKQLHAIIETGDYHGGMCFGDGIQSTTGCTFGKGNIEKSGEGKFAVTLFDKAAGKAVRVAYRPTLQPRIKATPFMQKRAAGVPPTEIPDEEQMEVVHLLWDAPAEEIMTVGPVEPSAWSEPEEVVRFAVCPRCGELVAEPYLRVAEGTVVCAACSGYPR